jgi:DNA-binding MarR family transcriptional regulator
VVARRASKSKFITDLLSARLHTLAALSAASASLRVERKYSLTLLEWRSLAHLGGYAPLSLKDLAHRTGMEKSNASRTMSSLIERGLVRSEKNDVDARGVMLRLTEKGTALYKEVFADALGRNERLLEPLSEEKRELLMEMLTALTDSAKQVLHEERLIAKGELQDSEVEPKRRGKGAAPLPREPLNYEEIEDLVGRLNALLACRDE